MKNPRVLAALGLLLVISAVGSGLIWFFKDDAPPEVSLEAATGGSKTGSTGQSRGGNVDTAGTWVVDTDAGGFDFESATGSFVGFRVEEELSNIGSTTAVGRTGEVNGSIEINGTELTEANFEVDLKAITTNQSLRDNKVQQALDTTTFPTATFELTEPVDFGDVSKDGTVNVSTIGDLTVHGITKPVEIPLGAKLRDGAITIVGSTDIKFSDYGVTVPSSPIVLSVQDHGILELQLHLKR